jgi:hypothetical protein
MRPLSRAGSTPLRAADAWISASYWVVSPATLTGVAAGAEAAQLGFGGS